MQGNNRVALLLLINSENIMFYEYIEGYSSKNYGPGLDGDCSLPAWVTYYGGDDIRHWAEFFAPETETCKMSHWKWSRRWYIFNA
tara:strand:- start:143 stop:397 length:255 start_codon:yes stop_codon:yes gene_type:complete